MDKYGYCLNKNTTKPRAEKRYHKTDLMQMTTFQLREICRREKLIQGIIDPMDKEELVRVILRFRGSDEYVLFKDWTRLAGRGWSGCFGKAACWRKITCLCAAVQRLRCMRAWRLVFTMGWCCLITENLQEPMLLSWAEMGVCVP